MKRALSLLLAAVLMIGCLAGVSFAADPIAEVTNSQGTSSVTTVDDLLAAVESDGNTKIKLLTDVTVDAQIQFPYSCTIDFAGHTITNTGSGNCVRFLAAGSANSTATVKNGTILCKLVGVRVDHGGIIVDNMTIRSTGGTCVGVYEASATNVNTIKDSVLLSDIYLGLCFYTVDHSGKTNVTIENTDLVTFKPAGHTIIWKNGTNAKCGTVTFGKNVNLYTFYSSYGRDLTSVAGETVTKATGTYSYDVQGTLVEGMNKWYTDPLATVETGGTTVKVTTVEDMVANINPDGTSTVTLYDDITLGGVTNIPICTLDLNGHTWKTTASNVLAIVDNDLTDNANCYTVIKNGTIHGAMSAIRHETGGLKISNCLLRADGSAAIQILDEVSKGNYNDGNIIENSVLDCTIWAALAYNRAKDFSALSYKIVNSDLIASKPAGTEVLGKNGSATSGTYELGENVNIYTYKTGATDYVKSGCPVTGEALTQLSGTHSVDARGTVYEGLTRWTTETAATVTVSPAANGTVTVSPASAYSGQTVTVTATPASGYQLSGLTLNGQPLNGTTFVMPKGGAVVAATFEENAGGAQTPTEQVNRPTYHGIEIAETTGGKVTASAEKATINTIIDLDITPDAGYAVDTITVKKLYNGTNAKVTDNSFYMPYSNVVVTVTFKKA